jgi:hypothetical protein
MIPPSFLNNVRRMLRFQFRGMIRNHIRLRRSISRNKLESFRANRTTKRLLFINSSTDHSVYSRHRRHSGWLKFAYVKIFQTLPGV